MRQKMVIRVSMKEKKSHSKALKIVVGASGVESAALKGQNKDQIEVIGDEVDIVELRKKFGHAEVVSVAIIDKNKDEKKPDEHLMVHPATIWPSYVQPNLVYPSYNGYYHNNCVAFVLIE